MAYPCGKQPHPGLDASKLFIDIWKRQVLHIVMLTIQDLRDVIREEMGSSVNMKNTIIKDNPSLCPITWIHALMKRKGLLPEEWELTQCLFGEHLLSLYPDRTVALVE